MINSRNAALFASIGTLALTACGIVEPGEHQQTGVIQFYGDTTEVTLPSTVAPDATFSVRFHTFGGGCVSLGESTVEYDAMTAIIKPTDRDSGAQVCTDELRFLQHEALVRFPASGSATVVVQGESRPDGGTLELRLPVMVEVP